MKQSSLCVGLVCWPHDDIMTHIPFKSKPNVLVGWKSELAPLTAIALNVISPLLVFK